MVRYKSPVFPFLPQPSVASLGWFCDTLQRRPGRPLTGSVPSTPPAQLEPTLARYWLAAPPAHMAASVERTAHRSKWLFQLAVVVAGSILVAEAASTTAAASSRINHKKPHRY
ncbi:hypothetical protein TWF696_000828 [Orbilia brochopaga]|uniref:Uncharacterized protein n=1 Tax=Orbilia brochopaga TaxID=3140254 RepID=A0AAV9VCI1_9PEZI